MMPLDFRWLVASALILLTASSTAHADAWTRAGDNVAANRVIIGYNEMADKKYRSSISSGFGIQSAQQLSRYADIEVIQVWDGLPLKDLVRALQSEPYVAFVEPDYKVSIDVAINDENIGSLYAMTIIKARKAWDFVDRTYGTANLKEAVVCVIDTGVDYTHPDLRDNMWVNQLEKDGKPGVDDDGNGYIDDIYGINAINGRGNPMDDNRHGTHCAGTIAAVGNNNIGVIGAAGPSNKVKIMACKFLDQTAVGHLSGAIACMDYALQMGATITSNSWSGVKFSLAHYRMVQRAADAGQLMVAAAGNLAKNSDMDPNYPASMPQRIVLSVASTDENDRLSSFSNYGRQTVDIAAPGQNIISTVPGGEYQSLSGTSMATPLVAGIAALMKAIKPSMSGLLVKKILMEMADRATPLGRDITGSGRLNAFAVVTGLDKDISAPKESLKLRKAMSSPAQVFYYPFGYDEVDPDLDTKFDLEGTSLTFRSPRSWNGYKLTCKQEQVTSLPIPRKKTETVLNLEDDDSVEVEFKEGFKFEYYGVEYSSVFVGSNGYLTFGTGDDADYIVDPAIHFKSRRISVFFADIDPTSGGQVTYWQKKGKKPSVTITWDDVPRRGPKAFGNTFQVTLMGNGDIIMSYISIDLRALPAIIGLSPGQRHEMSRIWDVRDFSDDTRKCPKARKKKKRNRRN